MPDDTKDAYELARQEIMKLTFLEDFIHLYMMNEKLTEPIDRFGILNYQIGDICKMIIYMKAYPDRKEALKEELKIAVGDAFVQLLCVCRSSHVDFYQAALIGLDKLAGREWEKKKSKTQAFR
jgi:hypothetical protein